MFGRRKVKVGLALGGGGARGFTHLGAIKAFEEFGVKFDYIAGTSAGSLVGAFYSAGYTFEEMYNIATSFKVKDIRKNIIPFTPSKLDGLEAIIKENLGEMKIEQLPIPFSAVAVDIKSTKEVCLSRGDLAKAVCGSCAVPAIFHPVAFDNMLLCDGGLQNTIPADIPRHYGCDYVVSIDVNKSRGYGTESGKFIDVVMCSIRILMKSNAVRGYVNSDVIVAPETKRFKATKAEGIDEMIEEGYKATVDLMPQIMALFKNAKKKKLPALKNEVKYID